MRHLKKIVFSLTILGLVLAIACTKLGPVPEFEYTYDFDATLPDPDLSSITAETVNITPGSIDDSGYSDFSSALSNPTTASNYAAAVNTAFTAGQQTYWNGQTQGSILTLLQNGDATARSQVASAISSFLSNPTLTSLLPDLAAAAGNLVSNSGRIGYDPNCTDQETLFRFVQFFILVQDQELEDCRQAALDAFDIAQTTIDDLLTQQLADIQAQYNSEAPLTEAQRSGLESDALTRHNTRLGNYLTFYNTTASTISTLLGGGSITNVESDLLNIVNLAVYAAFVDTSITLYNSELALIDTLINQATANLVTYRDNLINQVNNNYTLELERLILLRDNTLSKCHNQGGTNIS